MTTFTRMKNLTEKRKFEFPDELFDEAEFNRLVSFSKSLGESSTLGGSTLGDPLSVETLPRKFGKFNLMRLLGHGKTGRTYLAHEDGTTREVALKTIHRELVHRTGIAEFEKRLEQLRLESTSARVIDLDSVLPAVQIGEIDGDYFIATQYVKGKSLARLINSNTLSNRQAAKTIRRIADSIQSLHRIGIYHRDIQPENILLDESNRPQILELGAWPLKANRTNQNANTCSPFQAPELVADPDSSPATAEIWSIGATLYNCLVGEPPQDVVQPPRKLNPRVAKDLETICLKCLQKKPAQRYSSVAELAEDLELFLEYQPIKAVPSGWFARLVGKFSQRG
ncbi:serine/threonine-protein kinase [Mariniblastus fucicola]|uniref:Serine/threonine-protein kinase PrkC n=1 Tax=Mariniblastus fucicola TaxID=980251 RepID=A0A5B9PFU7_9BACT|nr:serine/threonine-protein kinase [Mariniblastus fucicola]QEG24449.1 Serine/threonine-protein kinase PrkC [Mariniblastus fucicola]